MVPSAIKTLQWGQGSGTENVKSNRYMHYYGVQAAMNRGGDVWTSYNKAFRDAVLSGQNADGSFRKNDVVYVSGMTGKSENIYRQCLACLLYTSFYPAESRGEPPLRKAPPAARPGVPVPAA